jgi:hypothetical protein
MPNLQFDGTAEQTAYAKKRGKALGETGAEIYRDCYENKKILDIIQFMV